MLRYHIIYHFSLTVLRNYWIWYACSGLTIDGLTKASVVEIDNLFTTVLTKNATIADVEPKCPTSFEFIVLANTDISIQLHQKTITCTTIKVIVGVAVNINSVAG